MDVNAELVISTVNYKTPQHTCECIDSVMAERDALPPFQMVIVDNLSGDDSLTVIQQHIDAQNLSECVSLIAAPRNGGYAYGNNLAIQTALDAGHQPAFIWFLNPDTRIYPGAGKALINFLKQHPSAGMTGSRLEDEDGTPQVSAFRFPSPISEFIGAMQLGILDRLFRFHLVPMPISDQPSEASWLAGASMMMKAQVMEDIGLMDETYFLYFEEVDYCVAAKRHKWKIWNVPASRVYHAVGAATGISDHRKKAPRRPQYWFESRRRFFLKNFGKLRALMSDLALLSGYSIWRLRRLIQRKPDIDPPYFIRDLITNSVLIKGFSIK